MTNHTPSTWFITGASSGIGLALALAAAGRGDNVVALARDVTALGRLADQHGDRALVLSADVRRQTDVDDAVSRALASFSSIDIVANNAGYGLFGAVEESTDEQVRGIFDTNVFGAVRVTTAFLPALSASAQPMIVNVTSSIGSLTKSADPDDEFTAYPQDVYRASKAALNMFTVQYAKAFPAMRINCVDPGLTRTDMMGGQVGQPVPDAAAAVARVVQLGPTGPTGQFFGPDGGVVPW